MLTDVAENAGSQQSVGDGVSHEIAVRGGGHTLSL